MTRFRFHMAILLCFACEASAIGQAVGFVRDVLPVIQKHCIDCHGPELQESKLRLDSMLDALRGGNSGEPTIVPGNSRRSHLIERVEHENPLMRMPPDSDPLSDTEVVILRKWIDNAQAWSGAMQTLSQQTTKHWSFQPLMRSNVPQSSSTHPIDVFVEDKLAAANLRSSPRAEKRRLIRRLFLVMHGLPPTPQQVERFVSDQRADAWQRLVDHVLSSPRYGERWATHWLDIVRFSETNGFETNRERPNAFHFRDWVIDALNGDKPYDQFAAQQIAGDALGEPVGTSFLVAGPNDIVKGQDALLGLTQRQDELADIVNTVGTTFLGLTTGCARCHNHKFDPISQSDFYAMQAVFSGVEHGESDLPLSPQAKSRIDELEAEMSELTSQLTKYARNRGSREPVSAKQNTEPIAPTEAKFIRFTILKTNGSEPCIDELQIYSAAENVGLASGGAVAKSSGDFVHPLHKLEYINDGRIGNSRSWIARDRSGSWVEVELPRLCRIDRITWSRDSEGKFTDRLPTEYRIEASVDRTQWSQVASSDDRLPSSRTQDRSEAYDFSGLTEKETASARQVLERIESLEKEMASLVVSTKVYAGNFHQPPPTYRLHRGDPEAPREQVLPDAIQVLGGLSLEPSASEQQRRIAIANWIGCREHPLTARVMVNRLWQFHFGTGIVDTPNDFGANGARPTHPELLDWLASELTARNWSLKQIHRLILTSEIWQQDSRPREVAMRVDATSRLLWRFPPRRLEAEGIRDCVLATSGQMDLTMGGPGFSAFEIAMENVRHYFPKKEYGPSDWRRMVYMTKVRQEKDSVFGLFDCPDGSQVAPKRSRSTTPLQALNLLNSHFMTQQAQLFSERLCRESGSTEGRIARAYELCFGRPVQPLEVAEATTFINAHGWNQFARALLNTNEFVFVP